jgi:hypothetical protein
MKRRKSKPSRTLADRLARIAESCIEKAPPEQHLDILRSINVLAESLKPFINVAGGKDWSLNRQNQSSHQSSEESFEEERSERDGTVTRRRIERRRSEKIMSAEEKKSEGQPPVSMPGATIGQQIFTAGGAVDNRGAAFAVGGGNAQAGIAFSEVVGAIATLRRCAASHAATGEALARNLDALEAECREIEQTEDAQQKKSLAGKAMETFRLFLKKAAAIGLAVKGADEVRQAAERIGGWLGNLSETPFLDFFK